jgi:signal recognition particle receptor subunit beta
LSVFHRLAARLRRHKIKEPPHEAIAASEPSVPPKEPAVGVPKKPVKTSSVKVAKEPTYPAPVGTLVASDQGFMFDSAATKRFARAADIRPQMTAEIVPGKLLKRDEKGRIHIKIVFYGPSLSGKTTALRWLFANVRSLSKGKIVEVADELGRTTFFDFVPISASEKIVFDVFTVAGQRRHASNRIAVLRDADGLIFMADSTPEQMNENLASIGELRLAMGTDRMATLPIVVALNKRDVANALPIDYMVTMMGLEGYPVFETVATAGTNLLRMFQRILRDALVFKVGI